MQEIILHPIRVRIIQLLAYNKSLTVAALAEMMNDIPRSTIYRHVRLLHENEILIVVKEQKIRGTYERGYALNNNNAYASEEQTEQVISGLLLKIFSDFSNYFRSPDALPVDDKLFFSVNSLLLSDDEFDHFKEEIYSIIKKHLNLLPETHRKTRNISIISSP